MKQALASTHNQAKVRPLASLIFSLSVCPYMCRLQGLGSTYVLANCDVGQHVVVTHQAGVSVSLDVCKPVAISSQPKQKKKNKVLA